MSIDLDEIDTISGDEFVLSRIASTNEALNGSEEILNEMLHSVSWTQLFDSNPSTLVLNFMEADSQIFLPLYNAFQHGIINELDITTTLFEEPFALNTFKGLKLVSIDRAFSKDDEETAALRSFVFNFQSVVETPIDQDEEEEEEDGE